MSVGPTSCRGFLHTTQKLPDFYDCARWEPCIETEGPGRFAKSACSFDEGSEIFECHGDIILQVLALPYQGIFRCNVGDFAALVLLSKHDMDFFEKLEIPMALGCNVLGHRKLWKQLSALALAFAFKIDR